MIESVERDAFGSMVVKGGKTEEIKFSDSFGKRQKRRRKTHANVFGVSIFGDPNL